MTHVPRDIWMTRLDNSRDICVTQRRGYSLSTVSMLRGMHVRQGQLWAESKRKKHDIWKPQHSR